jgi:predicted  nucleic acid-binding Zn-ribbon protein
MERAESLAAELKREEGLLKAAEEEGRVEARSLEARAHDLEGEAGKLGGERDAIAATIPAEALDLFQRVARRRGAAVAEARDGMCQLCHLKLRPQMYVDVKKNEGILQCPACSRILYYLPPVPAVSPVL